jgi:hypothetical protein
MARRFAFVPQAPGALNGLSLIDIPSFYAATTESMSAFAKAYPQIAQICAD